jgi:hypothetical protein
MCLKNTYWTRCQLHFLSREFIQQVKKFIEIFFWKIYAHENRAVMWNVWKKNFLIFDCRFLVIVTQLRTALCAVSGNYVRETEFFTRERNYVRMRGTRKWEKSTKQGATTLHNLRADKHAIERNLSKFPRIQHKHSILLSQEPLTINSTCSKVKVK